MVEGGVFDASKGVAREDSFGCTTLFHTRMAPNRNVTTKFIADVDHFTVRLDHTVEQTTMNYKAIAGNMDGWLEVNADTPAANQLCKDDPTAVHPYSSGSASGWNGTGGHTDHSPCWISPPRDVNLVDYFTIETLLIAAGIDLDEIQGGV